MAPHDFRVVLLAASDTAVRFARQFVTNELSLEFRYRVLLNQSYDGNASPDDVLYPDDDGVELSNLTADQVVDCLCRDGCWPQWIDISANAVSPDYTLLRLLCCGRFTDNPAKLYYQGTGTGPFGIKGPMFPVGHINGTKFTLPTV
ncbi:hypothetical protein [Anatilimnocola floriformis]|uniref:hypothetical protein n=1 Tax=Anatilimnocola floriformis TaxID=2948575 RepID=UPI0020C38F76|nr:hypothetical protein [Anatilimnocola floriformis]